MNEALTLKHFKPSKVHPMRYVLSVVEGIDTEFSLTLGFKSCTGHVGKLPVTLGYVMVSPRITSVSSHMKQWLVAI